MDLSRGVALTAALVSVAACSDGHRTEPWARSSLHPLVLTTATTVLASSANDEGDVDTSQSGLIRSDTKSFGLSSWQTVPMPARYEHAAVAHNGFLYVVGGRDDQDVLRDDVLVSQLGTSGAPSSFVPSSVKLSSPRRGHGALVYNGILYVLGGMDAAGRRADVEFARIQSNGSLDTFASTQALPVAEARSDHEVFARDGRLYVMGGQTAAGLSPRVLSAPVLAQGGVGSWTEAPDPIVGTRENTAAVSFKDHVVFAGGLSAGVRSSAVTSARFNETGNTINWVDGKPLLEAVSDHAMAFYGGALYVAGGRTATGVSAKVHGTKVLANGAWEDWLPTAALPAAREKHALVAHRGVLYALGGKATNGSVVTDAAWAPINGTSTSALGLGAQTLSGLTNEGVSGQCLVVYKGHLYFVGGFLDNMSPTTNDDYFGDVVDVARVLPGGFITTPVRMTERLKNGGRRHHMCFAHRDVLYSFGGHRTTDGYLRDMQWAPIGNGSVGQWTLAANTLHTQALAKVVTHGDFVYFVGGMVNGIPTSRVRMAQLLPNGGLGTWSDTTPFPAPPRHEHGVAVWNGRIYVQGGLDSTDSFVPTMVASDIGPTGELSAWTALAVPPTQLNRAGHSLNAVNGTLILMGGLKQVNSRRDPQADVWIAPLLEDKTVGTWREVTPLPYARAWHATTVYQGRVFTAGGANGTSQWQGVFLVAPPVRSSDGVVTQLLDVGEPVTPVSLTVTGSTDRRGTVWMRYRPVLSTGALGTEVHAGDVRLGTSVPVNAPGTRGMWVRLGLDDTLSGAPTSASGARDVLSVSLEYDGTSTPTSPVPTSVSLTLERSPTQNEMVHLTAQVLDAAGQPIAISMPLELTAVGGECSVSPQIITTDSTGRASVTVLCTSGGSAEVCGESPGRFKSCTSFDVGVAATDITLSLEVVGTPRSIAGGGFELVGRVTNVGPWRASGLVLVTEPEQAELREAVIGSLSQARPGYVSLEALEPGETVEVQLRGRRRQAGVSTVRVSVHQAERTLAAASISLETDRLTSRMGCACRTSAESAWWSVLGVVIAARARKRRAMARAR